MYSMVLTIITNFADLYKEKHFHERPEFERRESHSLLNPNFTLFSSCRNNSDFLCSYPLPSWVHFSGSPPGPLPLCFQTSPLFIVLLPHVAWKTLQWSELPLRGTQDFFICTLCPLLLRRCSPDAWSHMLSKLPGTVCVASIYMSICESV